MARPDGSSGSAGVGEPASHAVTARHGMIRSRRRYGGAALARCVNA